mmetsp:Transcript_175317/g.562332  ORF Transcript_175317/g.562332 Transcript_175317/m.562332 type:complete len:271 (+) Transcript_175317:1096-1908(+)
MLGLEVSQRALLSLQHAAGRHLLNPLQPQPAVHEAVALSRNRPLDRSQERQPEVQCLSKPQHVRCLLLGDLDAHPVAQSANRSRHFQRRSLSVGGQLPDIFSDPWRGQPPRPQIYWCAPRLPQLQLRLEGDRLPEQRPRLGARPGRRPWWGASSAVLEARRRLDAVEVVRQAAAVAACGSLRLRTPAAMALLRRAAEHADVFDQHRCGARLYRGIQQRCQHHRPDRGDPRDGGRHLGRHAAAAAGGALFEEGEADVVHVEFQFQGGHLQC